MPMFTDIVRSSGAPWANSAADWSPLVTVSGTACSPTARVPNACTVGTQAGRISTGMPKRSSSSRSQSPVWRFHSSVREALAGSTTAGRSASSA